VDPRSSRGSLSAEGLSSVAGHHLGPNQSRLSIQVAGSGLVLAAPGLGLLLVEWMAAQVLSVREIGLIQLFLIPAQSIASIVLLGTPVTLAWWASVAVGRKSRPPVIPTVGLGLVIGGFAAFSLLFLSPKWPGNGQGMSPELWMQLAVLLSGFLAGAAVWEPMIIAMGGHRWAVITAGVSMVAMALMAAVLLLLPDPAPLLAIPTALITSAVIRTIGSAWFFICVARRTTAMGPPEGLASFAIMAAAIAIMDSTSTWADRIIVSTAAKDPAQLALYRYGARELPMLAALTGALALVLRSRLTAGRSSSSSSVLCSAHVAERLRWTASSAALLLALIPVGTWLGIYAPNLFTWVYGPQWSEASTYFRIYLVLLIARGLPLLSLLQAEGFRFVVLLGALVDAFIAAGLGAFLVLGLGMGPQAAAWCFVVGTLIQTGIYAQAAQRHLGSILPWRALGWSLLGSCCVLVVSPLVLCLMHASVGFVIQGLLTLVVIRLLIRRFCPPLPIPESSE
jgi:hypothetical protein